MVIGKSRNNNFSIESYFFVVDECGIIVMLVVGESWFFSCFILCLVCVREI